MDTTDILEKLHENHVETLGRLANIDKTLVANTESLIYHIKRTDILDGQVNQVKGKQEEVLRHVHKVETIWKILCYSASGSVVLFGVLMAIYKAMK